MHVKSLCRFWYAASLCLLISIAPVMANAGDDNDSDGTGHYLGQLIWVMKQCGHFDLAQRARSKGLQDFGNSVRKGEGSLGGFDEFHGSCPEYEKIVRNYLGE